MVRLFEHWKYWTLDWVYRTFFHGYYNPYNRIHKWLFEHNDKYHADIHNYRYVRHEDGTVERTDHTVTRQYIHPRVPGSVWLFRKVYDAQQALEKYYSVEEFLPYMSREFKRAYYRG